MSSEGRGNKGNTGQVSPQYTVPIQQHGRTFWDVISENRLQLTIIVGVVVSAVAVTAYSLTNGIDPIISVISGNWPVLIAPIVGWVLGRHVAVSLYRPSVRMLVHVDPENHMLSVMSVPEDMFRTIDQLGNNVVYHTPRGNPVYLVRDFDPWNGIIDYDWIHTMDPLIVMTRESAYNRWRDTLDRVVEENLSLMHDPHTIGLGYARDLLRRHLDDISRSLGLIDQDFDGHETTGGPKKIPEAGIPSGDGQSDHDVGGDLP